MLFISFLYSSEREAVADCSAALFTYRFGGVNLSFTDCVVGLCYLLPCYVSRFKMNLGAKTDVKLRQLFNWTSPKTGLHCSNSVMFPRLDPEPVAVTWARCWGLRPLARPSPSAHGSRVFLWFLWLWTKHSLCFPLLFFVPCPCRLSVWDESQPCTANGDRREFNSELISWSYVYLTLSKHSLSLEIGV